MVSDDTMTILTYPNLILTSPTKPIENGEDLQFLMEEMRSVIEESGGIGLAANQIGIRKNLVYIAVPDIEPFFMVNPAVMWKSLLTETVYEGCLSFKRIQAKIRRPKEILVSYKTPDTFEVQSVKCDGLLARCIQHEIDHLNGKTLMDHLDYKQRQKINAQLKMLK